MTTYNCTNRIEKRHMTFTAHDLFAAIDRFVKTGSAKLPPIDDRPDWEREIDRMEQERERQRQRQRQRQKGESL